MHASEGYDIELACIIHGDVTSDVSTKEKMNHIIHPNPIQFNSIEVFIRTLKNRNGIFAIEYCGYCDEDRKAPTEKGRKRKNKNERRKRIIQPTYQMNRIELNRMKSAMDMTLQM